MYCPLGNHLLRGDGVFITNPRHIRFVNKFFPDFLPFEKVCVKCKQDILIAYEYKMKRALAMRARNNVSLISSNTTDESSIANNQNNTVLGQRQRVGSSFTSSGDDDNQPTTSGQAAARRKRHEHRQRIQAQNLLAINVQRGARLPHIQPVARRRQFIHANPDIMDIYLKGNMDSDTIHSLLESLSAEDGALQLSTLIVHLLSQRFITEYDWKEIENLVKIFIIFNESITINQFDQLSASENNQSFLKNAFNILYNEQTSSGNFDVITENILKSANHVKSTIILDNILSHIKTNFNLNLNLNAFSHKLENLNLNKKKMYAVIERIFVLPPTDIENSIEAVIKNIDFEIVGHVFCETSASIFFEKCTIVSDVICHQIENSSNTVMNFFMPSLLMSLKTKIGETFFLKCLENKQFSDSLNLYIKAYFIKLIEKINIQPETERLMFGPMAYLIYLHFSQIDNKSLEIFSQLNENNFLQDYLTNINLMYM